MIHVSQKKLDKSYRHLRQECEKNTPGSNAKLLLFIYAIESGVKALLLKKKHITDTYKLSKDKEESENLTHNLRMLLINASYPGPRPLPENFKFLNRSRKPETVSLADLHQALRYGGTFVDSIDKETLNAKLQKIDSWLQEELES
ncbi:hypothetical protein SAMN02746065_11313 [Desulfocicer vacuolatum DSM 3385]|uniref:HEPN domain-containing protein n=1 Tax=Desulfocicer vacuolatum DSM 3385 TaxID=1121400 RepID=A0A1W2CPX3_9BACT|nr:hypothetical protein [Desulfocicer vacuolatum]SMC87259.1 hypothetical protein SAMN02746065_11313 [Desulfocicer vacuolatum DSM 3385]